MRSEVKLPVSVWCHSHRARRPKRECSHFLTALAGECNTDVHINNCNPPPPPPPAVGASGSAEARTHLLLYLLLTTYYLLLTTYYLLLTYC